MADRALHELGEVGWLRELEQFGCEPVVAYPFGDGDIVMIFHFPCNASGSHRGNARKGLNITDRWRIVDGKIAEHWDSIQPMDWFARFYALLSGGRARNENGTY